MCPRAKRITKLNHVARGEGSDTKPREIVDEWPGSGCRANRRTGVQISAGSVKKNVLPTPGSLSTQTGRHAARRCV